MATVPGTTPVWKTAAAIIVALVVWSVVSVLVGALIFIIERILTETRPGIIGFSAAIIAGAAGVDAARKVCDKWPASYFRKALFVAFVVFAVLATLAELFLLPLHWGQITVAAQLIAMVVTAYVEFWQRAT
jgi:hypothetical protein